MGNYYCKNCNICINHYLNNNLPHNRPSCRKSNNPDSEFSNGYHEWKYYIFYSICFK